MRFVRWRPDRDPKAAPSTKLDVPLNYDLYDVLESRDGKCCRGTRRRRGAVRLTSPDKVYFPKLGKNGTKRKLVEYYLTVAQGPMLTALRDRPTHLQRFPDGIDGEEIYQKRCRRSIPTTWKPARSRSRPAAPPMR